MIDLEIQLMEDDPSRLVVLRAYRAATEALAEHEKSAARKASADHETVAKNANDAAAVQPEPATTLVEDSQDDESDEFYEADETQSGESPRRQSAKWLPRITQIEGIDQQELSKIHGQFIAYGLLKCDLADRSSGMVYQLTSTAKQVLNRLEDVEVDDLSEDSGSMNAAA
jgi:hypothetical protein